MNENKSTLEAIKEMVRSDKKPKPKSTVISLDKLHPFKDHPYKVENNEEMAELIESIRQNGVLNPVIVRPSELNPECYEIISGHRRCHAANEAGLKKVPALVYEIDRDEAAVMLVDSNIYRQNKLPSEKAFANKLKLDALKHQGKSTGQFVPNTDEARTTAMIGSDYGESYKTVQRYIRLTNLVPELLQFVDEGKIGLSPAVELSYLDEETQRNIVDCIDDLDKFPSHAQAIRMRKEFDNGSFGYDRVTAIMREDKPNQVEKIKLPADKVRGRIGRDLSGKELEEYILKAIDYYAKYQKHQRENSR